MRRKGSCAEGIHSQLPSILAASPPLSRLEEAATSIQANTLPKTTANSLKEGSGSLYAPRPNISDKARSIRVPLRDVLNLEIEGYVRNQGESVAKSASSDPERAVRICIVSRSYWRRVQQAGRTEFPYRKVEQL